MGEGFWKRAAGAEAVNLVRDCGEQVALVILDTLKQPMDAAETYRRMRATRPDPEFVLLSDFSRVEQARRLLGAGVAGHLQKPYRPDASLRVVRRVIEAPTLTGVTWDSVPGDRRRSGSGRLVDRCRRL